MRSATNPTAGQHWEHGKKSSFTAMDKVFDGSAIVMKTT
jgi:hypothetical protein